MKKSFKPASWIYPRPALVIVSQDKAGETDAMVAAWGGFSDYGGASDNILKPAPSPSAWRP